MIYNSKDLMRERSEAQKRKEKLKLIVSFISVIVTLLFIIGMIYLMYKAQSTGLKPIFESMWCGSSGC